MGHPEVIIEDSEFRGLVGKRAGALLEAARRFAASDPADADGTLGILTRPFLTVILSQASELEEFLDAYGALRNERWRPFRSVVAALKLFGRVHYALVHLAHAAPRYELLRVEGDLESALLQARRFTARVLHMASRRLVETGAALGLSARAVEVQEERLPPGRLPENCPLRRVDDVAGTVARLATAFLNLAEEASPLASERWSGTQGPASVTLPEETELRRLAEDFHNLQALYDTHVAHTDAERADAELPALRGHASVVYHLLDAATDLRHHYERHVLHVVPAYDSVPLFADQPECMAPESLEAVLRDCTLTFAARYVSAGRSLAQRLLRRYAEEGEVVVPVPRYRGFHVRPSTLVARVAYHYGSPVSMRLDDESYDASSPLELFRANEAINAKKRRWLAGEIARLLEGPDEGLGDDLVRAVRHLVLRLAEEAKVIVYEQPLRTLECPRREGQPFVSLVVEAIARLQALGKLDIVIPVSAIFRGDRRVLADLQLLAANGYGEDAYGNNVPLPDELKYLRR
ncbi:MAG TPA: HPr family phosphocarrier protein [Anaeromyxobacter sp.]|nr:HPr family phosphocarrier protein [Anaeromyxobacter sp.]